MTASKETKKEDLKRVIKNIKNVGGKIAGIVLNKVPIDAKKYEQSYYYGSTALVDTKPKSRAAKRASKEMYDRASSMIEKKEHTFEENKKKTVEERIVNEDEKIEKNITEEDKELEMPKALKRNIQIENAEKISLEKTAEILSQMNQYLDEEKKKLK